VSRLWHWTKTGLLLSVIVYLTLVIEYGDNCARDRAPWCDFLDASFALVSP